MVTTRTGVMLMLPAAWLIMVLVGAAVLSAFEGPNEVKNCNLAQEIFSDGIAETAAKLNVDLPDKLKDESFGGEDVSLVIMSEDQFNTFVEKVYQVRNLNKIPDISVLKSESECQPKNWNFVNSIWNAGSMISSLGFSYTAPETFEGKIFTAFYVMTGVPLFFTAIFVAAKAFALEIFIQLLRVGPMSQHISIGGLLIIVYSISTLIPAAIISTLEEKEFFESWYFATTTISTVGFGDFKLSGIAKSAWLLWIIISVFLQVVVFILIYTKLTISEFHKQKILGQEKTRLLDQVDGQPVQYGGGMLYRPTFIDPAGQFYGAPDGYDPQEYRTLSTLPIKPVDPQVEIVDLPDEADSVALGSSHTINSVESQPEVNEVTKTETKPEK